MWSRGWVADPRVGGGGNVLLVSVIATYMLGVYMEGCVTPVQGVIKCLIVRTVLIITSRVCTRARNHSTVLFVVKTFHSKQNSFDTTGVSTRVRNHTPVRVVVKTFHGKLISSYTTGVSTRVRNSTTVLIVDKTLH